MNKEGIIIAVDGFSACGKSTLAKQLALALGYTYIDTGAMYRAVTYFFLREQLDWNDEKSVQEALTSIQIDFRREEDGSLHTYLNGEDVEKYIRTMEVSESVSPVATISAVRRFLVKQQQALGEKKSCILDGRDIGTIVFPKAGLKIFLTADPEERARRRLKELLEKGQSVSLAEVAKNLTERDHIDSTREDSPLRQAEDAVIIDNTVLSPEEQLAMIKTLAEMRGA
ncbi:(d)CMP kinase [Lewinella cohaerens]|uniref:(d)CMP kinase n=1 Tax=Lewinella cohaerens TaxID=70995 RepID=UPI00036F43B1|nr:(d)CMP kinase [Lewinella cohaerens]